ncbi:hypothetical protein MRY82_04465 [bacterium]|nr:hypothetical protein [bacterium]
MNNNKPSLSETIDAIFYDLELDLHQALRNYEQDLQIIMQDTKKQLKK